MQRFSAWRAAVALAVGTAVVACGGGDATPTLGQVRPAMVAPGALMMLSGERMDRVTTVTVGGQPASNLTVINAGLLTVMAPPQLPPGRQPLELRATDGRMVYGAVTVAGIPAAAPPAAAPPPTPAPAASPSPSPTPTAPPATGTAPPANPGREDDDDKDDEEKRERKPDTRQPPGRGRGR